MITLYGVPRSRAMRALWMLEELGVPYENVTTSFIGETRTPEFLKLNPNGHIPVLRDGDLVVWESLAINLYLAMKYGKGGLWPASQADQGRAIQWSLWAMTTVESPLMLVLMNRAFLPALTSTRAWSMLAGFHLPGPILTAHVPTTGLSLTFMAPDPPPGSTPD